MEGEIEWRRGSRLEEIEVEGEIEGGGEREGEAAAVGESRAGEA
jgi:hypothetical protein